MLQIEYIDIDQLTPYENNAKKHPAKQVQQIAKSIKQFGMNDPIGVYGPDNVVVEGHGRMYAMSELGIREVPIVRLDHMTDEERKAYTIEHNRLTMETGFDLEILNDELEDLSEFDFGLTFGKPPISNPAITTMSFTLAHEQKELVKKALSMVYEEEVFDNKSKNGNKLYKIIKQWVDEHGIELL